MPADSSGEQSDDAEDEGKIIVRSNGTVTYVGKDIAYQLWKFGLLGRDFRYRPFLTYDDGRVVWASATEGEEKPFGRAAEVFNVIDSRQSYLQNIVVAGLRALGYHEQADRSVHFSYEMVALSQRCARELGIEIPPEDQKRPYVEVSGRKGQGVKADDFLDTLFARALAEVGARHPGRDPAFQQDIARQIAVGALRFFLLKFTRNAVIAFDFQDALNFDGETGPYVQYAAVRAANILRKLGETPDFSQVDPAAVLQNDEFWQLLILAAQADATAEQALSASEPAILAKYAFQLAQLFNTFYHRHHILSEEDAAKRLFLLWLADYVRRQLTRTLGWLGMDVPEVM
jgi:arginyl-tRNA synthetase